MRRFRLTSLLLTLLLGACGEGGDAVDDTWVGAYELHWVGAQPEPSSPEFESLGGSALLLILHVDGTLTNGEWRPQLGRWARAARSRRTGRWHVDAANHVLRVEIEPSQAMLRTHPDLPTDTVTLELVAPDRLRVSEGLEWRRVPAGKLGSSGEPREYQDPLAGR